MSTTTNFNLPKPVDTADVDEEFYRLQTAWDMLDLILLSMATQIAGKSSLGHSHVIADIVGLVAALANKMDASRTFSLDDLTDVNGAAEAALNYILVKGADGKWMPSSAIAALGPHQHQISDVQDLTATLDAKLANDWIHAAVAKAVPVDADELGISDSAASWGLKKLSMLDLFKTSNLFLADSTTTTKRAKFNLSGITAANTRYIRVPDMDTSTGVWEPIAVADLAGLSTKDFIGLNAFRRLRITIDYTPSAASTTYFQTSVDNGASFSSGASDYVNSGFVQAGTTLSGAVPGNGSSIPLASGGNQNTFPYQGVVEVGYFNKAAFSWFEADGVHVLTSNIRREWMYGYRNAPVALNAIRMSVNSGTWTSGTVLLEGIRG